MRTLDPEISGFEDAFADALHVVLDLARVIHSGSGHADRAGGVGAAEVDFGLGVFSEDGLFVFGFEGLADFGELLVGVGGGWVDAVLVVADGDFHFCVWFGVGVASCD